MSTRDIEWESERYRLGRCANCTALEAELQEARGLANVKNEVWNSAEKELDEIRECDKCDLCEDHHITEP